MNSYTPQDIFYTVLDNITMDLVLDFEELREDLEAQGKEVPNQYFYDEFKRLKNKLKEIDRDE